jgi:hypothetical protein
MKKLILTLTLLSTVLYTEAQTTTTYVEVNAGFSTGVIPFFPGASVLYGATDRFQSGFIMDYEGGIAFPTLITGKFGIGYDANGTEITAGVRPWPPATYGQVRIDRPNKLADIIISVEGTMFPNEFVQRAIFTIGWRFDNKRYKDIRQK